MVTDTVIFMREVRKLFPEISRYDAFKILNQESDMSFTWRYYGVNIANSPKKFHKIIRDINKMARTYTIKHGFAMG